LSKYFFNKLENYLDDSFSGHCHSGENRNPENKTGSGKYVKLTQSLLPEKQYSALIYLSDFT